jgi:hypothetical protein
MLQQQAGVADHAPSAVFLPLRPCIVVEDNVLPTATDSDISYHFAMATCPKQS